MHSFIFHLISFFLTFPVASFIMYITEGFDLHLATNMQFYGSKGFRAPSLAIFITVPIYTYFTLKWHFDSLADKTLERPNFMIFVNMVILVISRCVVASVKYGSYSKIRMDIYRSNYMSETHIRD